MMSEVSNNTKTPIGNDNKALIYKNMYIDTQDIIYSKPLFMRKNINKDPDKKITTHNA